MLFTSDAGGVGLNLQRAANCVINLELPWNPAVLEQRIGRIYRLGQKLPIDVYNLVCEQGIESRIAALVGSKQAFFKGLFDGDSDTVDFGQASSFLAKVQKLYEPAAVEAVASTGNVADEDADIADTHLDDEVDDPFDEMIEAADESRDPAVVGRSPTAMPRPRLCRSSPTGDVVRRTRAVESGRWPRCPLPVRCASSSRSSRFVAKPSGKVVIEAPAEAASTLGALFEGMAALLQSVAKPGDLTRTIAGGGVPSRVRSSSVSGESFNAARGCGPAAPQACWRDRRALSGPTYPTSHRAHADG